MTEAIDVFGVTSDVELWQAIILTVVSFAVGLLGGFVGLALGTMRLPALLLMGVAAPTAGGTCEFARLPHRSNPSPPRRPSELPDRADHGSPRIHRSLHWWLPERCGS